MDETKPFEIASERTGKDTRTVWLRVAKDGAIVMEAQDLGDIVKRQFDHDEYEFHVGVAPAALAKLAFELLRDKYAGQAGAVDALRDYCKERGIPHRFSTFAV